MMEEKNSSQGLLRRDFIKQSAVLATGIGAGTLGMTLAASAKDRGTEKLPQWPWPYARLDVEQVRKLGHKYYYEGGCMYGAAGALLTALVDTVGYPYTMIPRDMMHYGAGGVVGWGTVCGAINGVCPVMTLVAGKDHKKLIDDLMGWYCRTPFPSETANQYARQHQFLVKEYKSDAILAKSVADSPLCHVSVTTWCKTAGLPSGAPERAERCGRLTGDVAARAAELLNAHAQGKFLSSGSSTSACMECHGIGRDFEKGQFTLGKGGCRQCHPDAHNGEQM